MQICVGESVSQSSVEILAPMQLVISDLYVIDHFKLIINLFRLESYSGLIT